MQPPPRSSSPAPRDSQPPASPRVASSARTEGPANQAPERNRRPGQLLNFGSAWAFYLATVFLHLGGQVGSAPSGFYAFTRYALGFGIFGAWFFLERKRLPRRGQGALRFLILRGVFNLLALLCFYQSVAAGATGKANVLNMTYPAFVAMLAGPMLGERPDGRTIALVALAVTGMLLNIVDLRGLPEGGPGLLAPSMADSWGIASGVAAGFAIVSLRGAARVASPIEILCWMFGLGTFALLPFHFPHLLDFADRLQTGRPPPELLYILASAGCGILGQWSLSISYRYLDASSGSVISASRIPIALVAGVLFLGEGLALFPWLGAGLILLSNVLLATNKGRDASFKSNDRE